MWGNEDKEDPERGTTEEEQQDGKENRREDNIINSVEGEKGQGREGEHLEVAERMQEREEAKRSSEGKRAEEAQVMEGGTEKEGEQKDSQEILHQMISKENNISSDREDGEVDIEKSQHNTESCSPAAEIIPREENNTQENTRPSEVNIHGATDASSPSGNANTSSLSSVPEGEQGMTHSEKVNYFQVFFSYLYFFF